MSKIKVLYVDDEVINLDMFEYNLFRKYDILKAENGEKGLEIVNNYSDIEIVISDMRMPFMDGIEFITKAKELNSRIKYYILTGYEITDEIEKALQQGLILKYFQKPFNINEIDKEIQNQINR